MTPERLPKSICEFDGKHLSPVFLSLANSNGAIVCRECKEQLRGPKLPADQLEAIFIVIEAATNEEHGIKITRGGQVSQVDWVEAEALRRKYWNIRSIAVHFGVSGQTISRGFKKRNIR